MGDFIILTVIQNTQVANMSLSPNIYQGELRRLLNSPTFDNRCSDCRNPNPTWCSTTFHVFLCSRCASLHKQILNRDPYLSNIKSIQRDYWTGEDLDKFIHGTNNVINTKLYTASDSAHDIEELLKRKYMQPMLSNRDYGRQRRNLPVLTNRVARDNEIARYSRQVREIRSIDRKFRNEDNIIEALSLVNGNIDDALDILDYNYNLKRDDRRDNATPPSLPKRPIVTGPRDAVFDGFTTMSDEPKPAVFDGMNPFTSLTGTPSSIPQPKPAVFDGLDPVTSANLQTAEAQLAQQRQLQQAQQQLLLQQQQQQRQMHMMQMGQSQPGVQSQYPSTVYQPGVQYQIPQMQPPQQGWSVSYQLTQQPHPNMGYPNQGFR